MLGLSQIFSFESKPALLAPSDIAPWEYPGFPGGVGKTWEPGAFEELLGDVGSQLFGVYGDDAVVYPGHGDDTTLGAERPHLQEWRERGW